MADLSKAPIDKVIENLIIYNFFKSTYHQFSSNIWIKFKFSISLSSLTKTGTELKNSITPISGHFHDKAQLTRLSNFLRSTNSPIGASHVEVILPMESRIYYKLG